MLLAFFFSARASPRTSNQSFCLNGEASESCTSVGERSADDEATDLEVSLLQQKRVDVMQATSPKRFNMSLTEDSDVDLDYYHYGAPCVSRDVKRRRRNADMCSCRRRDGVSSSGQYWCEGNQLKCFREDCGTPCKPFSWPGKPCSIGEDCYNDWSASCGHPESLSCGHDGKCATQTDYDYYEPGNTCISGTVERRRRGSDMCACRRRAGVSSTKKYVCQGDKIKCFNEDCRTPCTPYAWPGKTCWTGDDCYNDWQASCGNPQSLSCTAGKCWPSSR